MTLRSTTLFFVTLCLLPSTFCLADDWPHWRGPNDTGIVSVAPINEDWAAKPPPVLWTVPMYDGGFAGPVIVNGVVYIEDHKPNQDMVRALDMQTGKELWETPFETRESETRCTVAVGGGKVFAFGRNGRAACVDAKDGHLIWTRDLVTEYQGYPPASFGFGSSPLIDGKQVIYCPGNHAGAAVVALDVDTGKEIWKSGSFYTGYGTPEIATLGGVRQYLIFMGNALISVKPDTGEVLWSYPWQGGESCNGNAPVVIGDDVLINSGYDRGFAFLDVSKGTSVQEIWKYNHQGPAWGSKICSPLVYKGCIYLSSENLNIGCLDLKTGKVLWSHPNDGDAGMIIVNDVLFTLHSRDSTLLMIRPTPDGYQELGRATVLPNGDAIVAPAFADGKLLVRNRKALACVDLSLGGGTPTPVVPTPPTTPAPTVTTPPTPPAAAAVGLPDLIITKVMLTPATPKAGDKVTFEAIVKNQGTAPTPDGVIIGVRFLVDTPTPVIWSDNETSALGPGKSVAVDATGGTAGSTWTATAGAHTLTAIVDDVNRIEESDETNNQFTMPFTVP